MEDDLNPGMTPEQESAVENYRQQENQIRAQVARQSYTQALTLKTSSDDVAKAIKKARKFGVPVGLANSITPMDEAQKNAEHYDWADTERFVPAFTQRIGRDASFANLVKDDLDNTSLLASLHWKMWGAPNKKPTNVFSALDNSTARGGWNIINTLPGFGAAQQLFDAKDALQKRQEWQKQLEAGKVPDETDPEGVLARQFWEKNGAKILQSYEKQVEEASDTVQFSVSMADMFPHSAATDELNKAQTLGEAVGA